MISLEELFRTLSSFSPTRVDLRDAPWEAYCDWAVAQGLGPLAAYNLEYRLGATRLPDWVQLRLLSLYQGSANDNVMKLVNLKRAIDDLEGRRIVLVGGASFADSLYPHVAFRPVIDVRLAVAPADVEPLETWLRRAEFKPVAPPDNGPLDPAGATRVLSDTRTTLYLHGALLPSSQAHAAVLARAQPVRAFGPSAYRLDAEDALVLHAVMMARQGFAVPMLEFIDLRELVLGAPSLGGPYSRPLDAGRVAANVSEWGAERATWCALSTVERLWPETAAAIAPLKPSLNLLVRESLERLVVRPCAQIGRTEGLVGEEIVRTLLARD
ncbi:MAG: nucleotidyltransferase family protein [Myxococcaceae bacterium]